MELILEKPQIQRSSGKTYDFKIGDEAFMLELARNKLYKNPLRVFPQEYMANARDAMIEAGKADEPIYVEIPGKFDSELKIQDFGLGMSPETIETVFTQYGISTKRSSNTQTGGFGLGSKSAWSYTDSFTITTINNGVEYIYSAYIDESRKGQLLLLSEVKTEKQSGTTISILIKDSDKYTIEFNIKKIVEYWTVLPRFNIGFEKDFVNLNNEKLLGFFKQKGCETTILVDEIPYYVDLEMLKQGITYFDEESERDIKYNLSSKTMNILKKNMFLFSTTCEEIKVSPNREDLDYCLTTFKSIEKHGLDAFKKMNEKISEIKLEKTRLGKIRFLKSNDLLGVSNMFTDIREVKTTMEFLKKIEALPVQQNKSTYSCENFYISKIKLNYDKINNLPEKSCVFLTNINLARKDFEKAGGLRVMNAVFKFKKIPLIKKENLFKGQLRCYKVKGYHNKLVRTQQPESFDDKIVITKSGCKISYFGVDYSLSDFSKKAERTSSMIFVSEKDLFKIENLKTIEDFVVEKINEKLAIDIYGKLSHSFSTMAHNIKMLGLKFDKKTTSSIDELKSKKFINIRHLPFQNSLDLIKKGLLHYDIDKIEDDSYKVFEKVSKKYPLLYKVLTSTYITCEDRENPSKFNDYIKMIEDKNKKKYFPSKRVKWLNRKK